MPSKNTELKQTFARGSANTLRNPAATAVRLKGLDFGVLKPRKAKKAITATIAPKPPIEKNTPRQPSRSPITPASTAPIRFPVSPTAKQPADRDLARMHRHQIADDRDADRKDAAGADAGDDAHGHQQREIAGEGADQRRRHHGGEADIHQPRLAEEIADGAERGLHDGVGKRERARQQRRGFYVDREIGGDLRNHRIDGAREQRRGENHQADDSEDGRNGEISLVGDEARAGSRSGAASAFGQLVELHQARKKRLHVLERNHIRAVGRRAVGVLVGLDEDAGDADRDGGPRQHRHVFALAAR